MQTHSKFAATRVSVCGKKIFNEINYRPSNTDKFM